MGDEEPAELLTQPCPYCDRETQITNGIEQCPDCEWWEPQGAD